MKLKNIETKPYIKHITNSQYFCVHTAIHITLYVLRLAARMSYSADVYRAPLSSDGCTVRGK
jgi:hypothetical protein